MTLDFCTQQQVPAQRSWRAAPTRQLKNVKVLTCQMKAEIRPKTVSRPHTVTPQQVCDRLISEHQWTDRLHHTHTHTRTYVIWVLLQSIAKKTNKQKNPNTNYSCIKNSINIWMSVWIIGFLQILRFFTKQLIAIAPTITTRPLPDLFSKLSFILTHVNLKNNPRSSCF